jgi:Putative metal-binding motif
VQVRGQGAVTVGGTSFRCASADPRPDAVGATCRYAEDAPGAVERVFAAAPAAAPAGNWVFGGWTGCPDTGGSPGECRIASPPGGDGARVLIARFEDVRPPHVTLGDTAIGDHGAEFTFAADEPAAFSCRLDNARAPCTSPVAYALDEGRHVFGVRATDAAGRRGESDTLRFVVVDTTLTDRDGFAAGTDCNDGNPAIHPGAFDDPADGVDQDCDGVYARPPDADGDGVRDALDLGARRRSPHARL